MTKTISMSPGDRSLGWLMPDEEQAMTELPAWVVERVADVLMDALTANRTNERDLSSEEITQETLAEFLAILEERDLRVVPMEPTAAMAKAASKPVLKMRRDMGENPPDGDWISNREKHLLRWRVNLECAPPLAELLAEKESDDGS